MRRIEAAKFYRDAYDATAQGIYNKPFFQWDGAAAETVRIVSEYDYLRLLRVARAAEQYCQTVEWDQRYTPLGDALDALNKPKGKR